MGVAEQTKRCSSSDLPQGCMFFGSIEKRGRAAHGHVGMLAVIVAMLYHYNGLSQAMFSAQYYVGSQSFWV